MKNYGIASILVWTDEKKEMKMSKNKLCYRCKVNMQKQIIVRADAGNVTAIVYGIETTTL